MTSFTRRGRGVVAGMLLALVLPATAIADPPVVTTGAAGSIEQTTANLKGSANPKKNRVVSFFQYGTSELYGSTTPETDRGAGNAKVRIDAPVGGLAPYTTYHYRAVVRTAANKLHFGEDRTFRTKRQPLGLTLSASPSVIGVGDPTSLIGNLSGTGNADREVVLQQNPHPFTAFSDAGNKLVTDAAGNFVFNLLNIPVTTQYRVFLPDKPLVTSPIVTVSVKIVTTAKVKRRVRRGRSITFRGSVAPANPGAQVEIQRRYRGEWLTISETQLRDDSSFAKKVKLKRTGRFRVLVTPGAAYVADASKTKRIKVLPRR